jgi:hypothetical protein
MREKFDLEERRENKTRLTTGLHQIRENIRTPGCSRV